ncbi:MAG: polysaccharide deacetylase family protein [Candidatus Thermoplasmatota archaeon]|nr:polysaccharide deacetylase family protein [Candidatus Thermoplasmatota archaeon]
MKNPKRSALALCLVLVAVIAMPGSAVVKAAGPVSHVWTCEENPGIENPVQYNYFNPTKAGDFTIFCSPMDVWKQVTAASVAGCRVDAYFPIESGSSEINADAAKVLSEIASHHNTKVILVGDKSDITPAIENWFKSQGCSVERFWKGDYDSTCAQLAWEYFDVPRCVAITTFNTMAAYLSTVYGGPAFAVPSADKMPSAIIDYLSENKGTIEKIFLVDVGEKITEQYQPEYPSYGNMKVPAGIEEELKGRGFQVERISGEYEEDVSYNIIQLAKAGYTEMVSSGAYARMPNGLIFTTSLKSEWTCAASLIPIAMAKEFYLFEGWNDARCPIQGRYGRNIDLTYEPSERRDHFTSVVSKLTSELIPAGQGAYGMGMPPTEMKDFTVAMATNFYNQNQIESATIDVDLPMNTYDVAIHNMKINGVAWDDTIEAWQQRAVDVLLLERFKFPPSPWGGQTKVGTVNTEVATDLQSNLASGKKGLVLRIDFEDIGGCIFNMQKLLEASKEYGLNWTFAITADNIEYLPDYLLKMYAVGNVEFGTHDFFHEMVMDLSLETQTVLFGTALQCQMKYLGIRPLLFVPPCEYINEWSWAALDEIGYKYMVGMAPGLEALDVAQSPLGAILGSDDNPHDIVILTSRQKYSNAFDSTDASREISEFERCYWNFTFINPQFGDTTGTGTASFNSSSYNDAPFIIVDGHSWNFIDDLAWDAFRNYSEYVCENYIKTGMVVSVYGREVQQFYRPGQPGLEYTEPVLTAESFAPIIADSSEEQSGGSTPGFEIAALIGAIIFCIGAIKIRK